MQTVRQEPDECRMVAEYKQAPHHVSKAGHSSRQPETGTQVHPAARSQSTQQLQDSKGARMYGRQRCLSAAAAPMFWIAKGMQKGFIFLKLVCRDSTALANVCMPPMAVPAGHQV